MARSPHPVRRSTPPRSRASRWCRSPSSPTRPTGSGCVHPSGWHGPGFAAAGLFVWGFTARLLDRLLELGGWGVPWDDTVSAPLPRAAGRPAACHRPERSPRCGTPPVPSVAMTASRPAAAVVAHRRGGWRGRLVVVVRGPARTPVAGQPPAAYRLGDARRWSTACSRSRSTAARTYRFPRRRSSVHPRPGADRARQHDGARRAAQPGRSPGFAADFVPLTAAGQTQAATFTAPAPGTYTFVCTIHVKQGQTGTLIVVALTDEPARRAHRPGWRSRYGIGGFRNGAVVGLLLPARLLRRRGPRRPARRAARRAPGPRHARRCRSRSSACCSWPCSGSCSAVWAGRPGSEPAGAAHAARMSTPASARRSACSRCCSVAWMVAVPLASSPYPALASARRSHSSIVRAVNGVMPDGMRAAVLARCGVPRPERFPAGVRRPAVHDDRQRARADRHDCSAAGAAGRHRGAQSVFKIYGQAPSCGRGIEGIRLRLRAATGC